MDARIWIKAALGLMVIFLNGAAGSAADGDTPISWKKTTIEGRFRSEGVAIADVNRDGKLDVLIGDSWYKAPSWIKHDIRKPGDYGDGLHSYSACMTCWTDDVNGDGWADVLASSAHQYGIWWFEQGEPKDGSPVFSRHDLFPDLVSETHALIAADINGDGLKDLVTGKRFWSHGKNEPGSDKPARLYWFEAGRDAGGKVSFTPREVDDQSGIGTQFVVADFNGDGLLDIVTSNKKGVFLLEQVRPVK
jgi:hypothetical protein